MGERGEIPGKERGSPPEWCRYSPKQLEELVVELAKQGYSGAQIGMILRDQYGIPSIKLLSGEKLTHILRRHGVGPKIPEDLRNLLMKAFRLRNHLEQHPKDKHNLRALRITESKIMRLVDYYKRIKLLPPDWTYSPDRLQILIS